MDAAAWFNAQSFHQGPLGAPVAPLKAEPKPEATWSSWDPESGSWRYYARQGDVTWETDEIGVAL